MNGLLLAALLASAPPKTVTFPSEDGLKITADLYLARKDPKTPFVVLFHQAQWSRGEYRKIAPKLNALGFNAMAVDLRSGNEAEGVVNETAKRARAKKKPTTYLDAIPDMRAALKWARKHRAKGELFGWGSSYSAALVIRIAGESPELMDAVLAFSPGEYFRPLGKGRTWIKDAAKKIHKPVFITSARREKKQWKPIFDAIPSKEKTSYTPVDQPGQHGSRALWDRFAGHEGYWDAVEVFLKKQADLEAK